MTTPANTDDMAGPRDFVLVTPPRALTAADHDLATQLRRWVPTPTAAPSPKYLRDSGRRWLAEYDAAVAANAAASGVRLSG